MTAPPMPVLVADTVSYRVDGRVVLEDVSVSVARGELVGLIGPNGAGKTTLIRLLGGTIRAGAGSVRVEGREVRAIGRRALARLVATVPQISQLSFDLTALEFALMGRHPHLGRFQLEGRADVHVAQQALAAMGAEPFAGRSVLTLSGGERQCVYLARGLAQEPAALLVDEPTASLDLANQVRVMELLRRLARERGLAVVVALHDLGLVGRYADRLVLLAGGRVVAEGSAGDVLTPDRIEQAFGVRATVFRAPLAGALALGFDPDPPSPHPGRERAERPPLPEGEGVDPGEGDVPLDDLSDAGRARKRDEQAAARRHPDRRAQGLVIVNTGDGKGKTTAALGLLVRAWGRNLRVVMFQFIKAATANWGENRAAARLGIELIPLGAGFTWMSQDIERDQALAEEGWALARERLLAGQDDVVILDELTYLMKFGWLDVAEVIETLRRRPSAQHVVITGRDAPAELVAVADLVTEMREVKHPYRSGVRAQPGVEF